MAVPFARLAALAAALAIVALARAPHVNLAFAFVSLGACLAVLGMAIVVALRPERSPRGLRPAVLAGSLATLLIPTSDDALLGAAPDWLVAGLVVAALHLFFTDVAATAPAVGGVQASPSRARRMVQYLPFAVATTLLLLAPLAARWFLPQRIHAAYELQGTLTPLAPLAVLAAALVLAGRLRSLAPHKASAAQARSDLATDEAGP